MKTVHPFQLLLELHYIKKFQEASSKPAEKNQHFYSHCPNYLSNIKSQLLVQKIIIKASFINKSH